ncbi:pancreatic lipase-related protein 2-like [Ostrinia nubilalis]|uniref:pancreatic lipase-related protein 2-like n=1 Tax=Ostrinia nubilalis TaxID=29057 RepID=UPI003082602F
MPSGLLPSSRNMPLGSKTAGTLTATRALRMTSLMQACRETRPALIWHERPWCPNSPTRVPQRQRWGCKFFFKRLRFIIYLFIWPIRFHYYFIQFQALAVAGPISSSSSSSSRFVEIPVEWDGTQLEELGAKPQSKKSERAKRSVDVNRYLLYTRQNPDSAQRLELDDEDSVLSSNFDPNERTAVLIHGFQALLQKRNTNVIVVDWRWLSSLDYVTEVVSVPSVGRHIGQFLDFLNALTGTPFSSIHLIGHSLGAHVAANAGKELEGRVARITGLDPAGPLWGPNPYRLKPSDAVYVEAIHTDRGTFGTSENVADADFYPNGGSKQPGCFTALCDHSRSYELFAASINNGNLVGKKCSGLTQMKLNSCRGIELPLGNDELQKTGSGIYRLNTGRSYPY